MKLKDKQLLSQESLKELINKLSSLEQELVETRFKVRTGKLKDVHVPIKKRREIAMIKTLITKQEEK